MSFDMDTLSCMELGDSLEEGGLLRGMGLSEPVLFTLVEVDAKAGKSKFTVSYLGIRLGQATVTFPGGQPTLVMD